VKAENLTGSGIGVEIVATLQIESPSSEIERTETMGLELQG
jgi:hypothetical protein